MQLSLKFLSNTMSKISSVTDGSNFSNDFCIKDISKSVIFSFIALSISSVVFLNKWLEI